ncbi:thioesterase-like superfamily-domain-containing protein, partial [Sporodiniella umbellata]
PKINSMTLAHFDQATQVKFLGKKEDSFIYQSHVSADWCIGNVPNVSYVASIALASVLDHFSNRHQVDPVALNSFFFQKTAVGGCIVEIEELKMTRKGYCVVRARLMQGEKVLEKAEDYKRSDHVEKVQSMVTMGNMDAEQGLTHLTDPLTPFDRTHLKPFRFLWMADYLQLRLDTRHLGSLDRPGRAEVNQELGFVDRPVDVKSLPYLCDMFIPPATMLGEAVHGGKVWVPTLQLEIQFKQKIPKQTDYVMAHFISRHIIHGRTDMDGELWDPQGRLLALTRHQCLVVPWSKNQAKI